MLISFLKNLLVLVIVFLIKLKYCYSAQFFYEIYFGPFKVGEAEITILKDAHIFIAKVYTTGLGDKIYPYYATWETRVDQNGYPIQTTIYSKERRRERKKILYFDHQNSVIHEEKILPKKSKDVVKVSFPIHDELSGFISVWNLTGLPSKSSIPLYIKREKTYATVEIQGSERCEFIHKELRCQRIKVTLPEKSELLKRSKDVTIFMQPEEGFPVVIKGSLPLFGSLKAVLKNFSL